MDGSGPVEGPGSGALLEWATEQLERGAPRSLELPESVRLETRVVFSERPELPHVLKSIWVGEDRARFELRPDAAPVTSTLLEFRVGGRLFVREPESTESIELEGQERGQAERRLAARRALWSTPIADYPGAPTTVRLDGVDGSLSMLRVDAEGVLAELVLIDADGREQARWQVEAADVETGLPARVRLQIDGSAETLWTEESVRRSEGGYFAEQLFWPADRWSGEQALGDVRPAPSAMPGRHVLRRELAERDRSWARVQELAAELEAAHAEGPLAGRLALPVGILADAWGRPIGLELSAIDAEGPAPPGWETLPDQLGWAMPIDWPPPLAPGVLENLFEESGASPPGSPLLLRKSRSGSGGTLFAPRD